MRCFSNAERLTVHQNESCVKPGSDTVGHFAVSLLTESRAEYENKISVRKPRLKFEPRCICLPAIGGLAYRWFKAIDRHWSYSLWFLFSLQTM